MVLGTLPPCVTVILSRAVEKPGGGGAHEQHASSISHVSRRRLEEFQVEECLSSGRRLPPLAQGLLFPSALACLAWACTVAKKPGKRLYPDIGWIGKWTSPRIYLFNGEIINALEFSWAEIVLPNRLFATGTNFFNRLLTTLVDSIPFFPALVRYACKILKLGNKNSYVTVISYVTIFFCSKFWVSECISV